MFPVAILAGGLATRLGQTTVKIPKSLVDIHGEPFIYHQLRLMSNLGIDKVVLCVGHLGNLIKEVVGDGSQFGLHVTYSFDGPVLQGTAGALCQASSLLGDNFFVTYGDSYLACDYSAIQSRFDHEQPLGLLVVTTQLGTWHANVEFESDAIIAIDEVARAHRPRMRHIDFGVSVLDQRALTLVPKYRPYGLSALYADLAEYDELSGYEVHEPFYEIGSLSGLEQVRNLLKPA